MVFASARPACWNWRLPPENTAKFGMPRTLYRDASSGNLSVSTFSTTARPARSRATCATWGAAIRQGPHHAAQKSTRTGTLLVRTISSKSSGLTSTGSAIGGSVVLQAPHLPVSARCFAGIRFGFPQDGQFRVMAMERSSIEFLPSQYLASRLIAATVDDLLRRPPRAWDQRPLTRVRNFTCRLHGREITCFARNRSPGVHAYGSRRKHSTDATLVSGGVE